MYEEFYENLPDPGAYLKRIGLENMPLDRTVETLDQIIHAHLTHIPFENLDAWAGGKAPELGIPALFDKIVLHRRGGWCFELNALLHKLLEALGFEVYSVGARVTMGRSYFPAVSHHGVVCMLDGKKYYCDVGFGSLHFRGAVPMDGSVSPYGFRAVENGAYTEIWSCGENAMRVLMFEDRPYEMVDFMFANYTNATKPNLPFKANLSASIMTEDGGRVQLANYTLREFDAHGALLKEAAIDGKAALQEVLRERLFLDYHFSE